MPALSPIPPDVLKRLLDDYGYKVHMSDSYNWVFVRKGSLPIPVPKRGLRVPLNVMMSALNKAKMDNGTYLALLKMYNQEARKPVS
jgi:hypothetical protein